MQISEDLDMNTQAYELVAYIEKQCDSILHQLEISKKRNIYFENQIALLQKDVEEKNSVISNLEEARGTDQDQIANLHEEISALNAHKTSENIHVAATAAVQSDPIVKQKVIELEAQNQSLEDKYQSAYRLLQKEMAKVDKIQMELELVQRERDIALRKQSLTPEQKQILIKLEHESYKINETIERVDFIANSLKKFLMPQKEVEISTKA